MPVAEQLTLFDLFEKPRRVYFCKYCGIEVIRKGTSARGRKLLCCRPCTRVRNLAHSQKIRDAKAALQNYRCMKCDVKLSGRRRKFCSKVCHDLFRERERFEQRVSAFSDGNWPIKQCEECTADYVARPHTRQERRYCSAKCGRKAILRTRTKTRRAATETEIYLQFSPNEIFWRDKWKCQICLVDTPAYLKGKAEPNAPQMDHIIPLSRGGEHVPSNCRCLCRSCNSEKSNRMDEEWLAEKPRPKQRRRRKNGQIDLAASF